MWFYLHNLGLQSCPYDGDFRCSNGGCVRSYHVCSGRCECGDCSDEVNCSKYYYNGIIRMYGLSFFLTFSALATAGAHGLIMLFCHSPTTLQSFCLPSFSNFLCKPVKILYKWSCYPACTNIAS